MNVHPVLTKLGWNNRTLTFRDFLTACHQQGVEVEFRACRTLGVFIIRRSIPFILLDENLRGWQKAFVAWHEFAHFLFEGEGEGRITGIAENSAEKRANLVALCAIMPRAKLMGEAVSFDNVPAELLRRRLQVLAETGF